MRHITSRTVGATVVLLGLLFAGLSQMGSGGDTAAIAITPEDVATTAAATSNPDHPGTPVETTAPPPFTYRVGVLSGVATDNFWAFYGGESSVWDAYILGPTKPALYSLDPADGSVVAELAAATVVPREDADGWHVAVPLTDQLSWSDGAPITAEDVAFTFQTVRALELRGSWEEVYPATVLSVEAVTPTELLIRFTERPNLAVWPYGPALAPVMPHHIWAREVADVDREALFALSGSRDVGGGPLTLAHVTDSLITSVANPGYLRGSVPDTVEYHVYPSETSAVLALATDEIDSILSPKGLAPSHLESIESDPAIAIETSPANGVRYLGFNLNRAPMSDQAFRTALALLLDRSNMAGSISDSSAAYSFVSKSNDRWFDVDAAQSNASLYSGDLPTRLSSAVEVLSGAGYTWESEPGVSAGGGVAAGTGLLINGLPPAPLTILTPGDAYDSSRPAYAAEISEALSRLGFDVRPVETDFDTVVDLAFTPGEDGVLRYDMYLLGWTLGNPAFPSYYRSLFAPDGAMNNTGYASSVFTRQLADYENSYTFADARQALWSMETTLSADLPYLLLYTTHIVEAYRRDRVAFDIDPGLGGLQGRLGGIGDVRPVD